MNKQEAIGKYKVGQKVAIHSYIDAIDIENVSDIENKTTLRIKTPVKTISVNPKYEEVVTDFNKSKPVVPQFVADWYEENKDYFEWNLYNLCVDFHARKLNEDLSTWFRYINNKPIETLVMMHKFGYEVEKEKLYDDNTNTTPSHYQGTIQPIDLINAQDLNFNLGNVVKYVCRAGKKQGENVLSDLEKAQNYINYEIERIKKNE